MADYRVIVCEVGGERVAEIPDARVERVGWRLNEPGSAVVKAPTAGTAVAAVRLLDRELLIVRNGTPLWWGIPVDESTGRDETEFRCRELTYYLGGRFVGDASRTNLLTNGSFESGALAAYPTSWVEGNADQTLTSAQNSAQDPVHGARHVILTNSDPGKNAHVRQRVAVTAGRWYYAAAWYRVLEAGWEGPAYGDRGLLLDLRRDGGTPADSSVAQAGWSVDERTPRDVWLRADAALFVPGDVADPVIDVRLYAPGGSVYWDDVMLAWNESLLGLEADQGDVFEALVAHAQDPAYGKTDLGLEVSAPTTGVVRSMPLRHADHANVLATLQELSRFEDGLDFGLVISGDLTRTLVAYHPRKGSYKPELRLDLARNVADFQLTSSGQDVANSVVALGSGDGASRDEAADSDLSDLTGNVWEALVDAPGGAKPSALEAVAAEQVRVRKRPTKIPRLTTHPSADDLVTELEVGDTVPVLIDHGRAQYDGDARVVGIDLDPRTESLTLDLDPA